MLKSASPFERYSLVALLVIMVLQGPSMAHAQAQTDAPPADASVTRRVMSFNLRRNIPSDSANAWPHRKDMVASTIRFHRTDLVGVQEGLPGMIDDLNQRLPTFDWFGEPRIEGDEYTAIFYRPDHLKLLDHDTFWLSETPDKRGSKGWDGGYVRIVTWGKFKDRRSGKVFYHFNTHLDNEGRTARIEGGRLLRRRSYKIAGRAPTLLTGDFNSESDDKPFALLTKAKAGRESGPAFHDAQSETQQPHYGPHSTWNGFKALEPGHRIDFIFVRGGVEVLQQGILSETFGGGAFPSDHLPVLATISFN